MGMSPRTLATAAAAMGLLTVSAHAADIAPGPYYSAPAYAPASMQSYSWMGPYIGANVGHQWGNVTSNPASPSGFAGGLQAGYNWQTNQFVFGAETDLQLSGADDTFAPWKFSNPWFGSTRARAGFALNNILIYGTGGFAYGSMHVDSAGLTEAHTLFGWAAGLGLEVGLTPNWSARAEYLYVDLNDHNYVITASQNGLESSLLRFGVNYRF
jgi:outer membrane immunogenic protein